MNETAKLPWCCGGGLSLCEACFQFRVIFRVWMLLPLHAPVLSPAYFSSDLLAQKFEFSLHRVGHFLSLVILESLWELENGISLGDSCYVKLSAINIADHLLCARHCLCGEKLKMVLTLWKFTNSEIKTTNTGEHREGMSNAPQQKKVIFELSLEGMSEPHKALGGEGLGDSLSKV